MKRLIGKIGFGLALKQNFVQLSFPKLAFFSEAQKVEKNLSNKEKESIYSLKSISSVVLDLGNKNKINEKIIKYLSKALDSLEADPRSADSLIRRSLVRNIYRCLAENSQHSEGRQFNKHLEFFHRKSFAKQSFADIKYCLAILISEALRNRPFNEEIFCLIESIARNRLFSHEREITINMIKDIKTKDWAISVDNEKQFMHNIHLTSSYVFNKLRENVLSGDHLHQLSTIIKENPQVIIKYPTLKEMFVIENKEGKDALNNGISALFHDPFNIISFDSVSNWLESIIDEGSFKKGSKKLDDSIYFLEQKEAISGEFQKLSTSQVISLGYILNQYSKINQNKVNFLSIIETEGVNRIESLRDAYYLGPVLYKALWNSDQVLSKIFKLNSQDKSIASSNDACDVFHYLLMISMAFTNSEENRFVNSMLKDLDSILSQKLDLLSLEQKCVLLPYLKNINTPSKHLICKFLIRNLEMIEHSYLPSVLFHLSDYSYNIINYEDIEKLVLISIEGDYSYSSANYLDLIKSFLYPLKGSDLLIETLMRKLDKRIHEELNSDDSYLKKNGTYPRLQCFLYQIIFTLSIERPNVMKSLRNNCYYLTGNSIANLREIYFLAGRGNSSKREQNSQELDLEQCLKDLELAYQKEKSIELFSTDFLVNHNVIIELYGIHHYCDKSNLTATSWWRERLLKNLGYTLINIPLKKWLEIPNKKQKIIYLGDLLTKGGCNLEAIEEGNPLIK